MAGQEKHQMAKIKTTKKILTLQQPVAATILKKQKKTSFAHNKFIPL